MRKLTDEERARRHQEWEERDWLWYIDAWLRESPRIYWEKLVRWWNTPPEP